MPDNTAIELPEKSVEYDGETCRYIYDLSESGTESIEEARELYKPRDLSHDSVERMQNHYRDELSILSEATGYKPGLCLRDKTNGFDEDQVYLLGRIMIATAWDEFGSGMVEEAVDTVMATLKVSSILEASGTGLKSMDRGMWLKTEGLHVLDTMITEKNLPADVLTGVQKEVGQYETGMVGFESSVIRSYNDKKNNPYGRLRNKGLAGLGSRRVFKPNRTISEYYDIYSETISHMDEPCGEMKLVKLHRIEPGKKTGIGKLISLYFKGNYSGALSATAESNRMEYFLRRRCYNDFAVRGIGIKIAVMLYEKENDKLPDTIDELVGKYMTTIPSDPFDGKPVRYSRKHKTIYTVGEDLVDDGGIPQEWEHLNVKVVTLIIN
ncbi:MAG TPA: hypothetical protein PLN69_08710 [bacterium]|nr:hypothetical protein [bacterium]